MAVGASLFAHLTGNNPLDSYAKGAAIRQAFDNANAEQTARGFQFLMGVVRENNDVKQHQDSLNMQMAQLQETARYHDSVIALNKAHELSYGGAGGFAAPPSGSLDSPGMAAAPPNGTPAGGMAIPSNEEMAALSQKATDARNQFMAISGGLPPQRVITDPDADPTVKQHALEVMRGEADLQRIASGKPTYAQERAMSLDPSAAALLGQPGGNSVDSSMSPELQANPALLRSPALPKALADAGGPIPFQADAQPLYATLPPQPGEQPMGNPRVGEVPQTGPGLRTGNPLLPPLAPTRAVPAPEAAQAGGKSKDPFDWSNIQEGGSGYRKTAADGSSSIIRRKSGGVMIEQKIDYRRGANGRMLEVPHPERVIIPDALSRAPMAVQLPQDKVQAYDTANFWLTKIYPKMDSKDAAANRNQAMGMNALMTSLANDPDVQGHLRKVGEKDFVIPPGFEIGTMHYDAGSKSMVPLLRRIPDAAVKTRKENAQAVKDAWSSYKSLQKAANDAPYDMHAMMEQKAAGALQKVMNLDPVFGATVGAAGAGGAAPAPDTTAAKVDRLSKLLNPH